MESQFSPKHSRFRGERFFQWFERKMMQLPDHIMVVSDELKDYYSKNGANPLNITSVPNGVDVNRFNPEVSGSRIRDKYNLHDKIVIGFSGNFAPWHGLDFLAEAMNIIVDQRKYDHLILLLIGKPGTNIIMPDFPKEITVITGFIPHDEMPEYLAAVDIFVAPYPLIEPFYFSPLKIFEAMSMGKPVIASAQGQISQLIDDHVNGYLYPPGDQVVFIKTLELLISDQNRKQQVSSKARTTIKQNYTWKDNAATMLMLCENLFKKNERIQEQDLI